MKKWLRVMLKGTPRTWFTIEVPTDTNMGNVIGNLQSSGYFMWEHGFVPYDEIAHITLLEAAEAPIDYTRKN